MRPSGSPEELERRRLRAIALLQHGMAPVEVARHVGVDRRSVRRWRASHDRAGRAGVGAKPAPGRPPKLDARRRARLERVLLRGAEAAGFSTPLWTCPRVAEMVRREFGVRYHVDHIGRVLRTLGWSPQKPERRARERDEAAIQRWDRLPGHRAHVVTEYLHRRHRHVVLLPPYAPELNPVEILWAYLKSCGSGS
jgi:transposase